MISGTVCYVLTSDGHDLYADLNLLSVCSLRSTNPKIHCIVVCDRTTRDALAAMNHPLQSEADEIRVIDTPVADPSFTNRFLKTSLRRHVDGPFLYLDGDTVVRGDLTPVFQSPASLAAVANHSGSGSPSEIPGTERDVFVEMGWSLPSHFYVNGGVLFLADNSEAAEFTDLWHERWRECSSKTGRHFDQMSLNSALNESALKFAWLDGRYNAQVHARPSRAWGAAIWHIYMSDHHPVPRTILDMYVEHRRHGNPISSDYIARICARNHPWLITNPMDWIAVQRLRRSNNILLGDQWERLWLADSHTAALRRIASRIKRRRGDIVEYFRKRARRRGLKPDV